MVASELLHVDSLSYTFITNLLLFFVNVAPLELELEFGGSLPKSSSSEEALILMPWARLICFHLENLLPLAPLTMLPL